MQGSSRYDDMVIEDRPSLYSVNEPDQTYRISQLAPGRNAVTDPRLMIEKLNTEIAHLENWLSHHLASRSRSLSLVNTIRSLIATRKSLLEGLLKTHQQR